MGFKVDIVELNNLPNLKTTNVKISDYSGIGTKVQKVVIVEGTNINLSSNNEAIQAAIEAKASAAEAKVTLANAVQKTGAQTMAGPLAVEGVLTTNSQLVVNDPTATYGQRLVTAGSVGYLQSGKLDRDVTDQKLMLSGWYGTDLSYLRFKLASGTNPQVAWGSSIHDVLHRGNMPTAEEIKAMAVYDRPTGDDCNNAIMPGNYGIFANTANTPHGTGPSGSTLLVTRWGNGASTQIFFTYTSDRVFVRRMYIGVWQPWSEIYTSANKQPVGGMGLGIGDAPNATTITGGVRDFNLAKTNGNFTVDGNWANGTSNTPTATGHSGLLQIFQRAWDNMTVQKYMTWVTLSGPGNLTQNEFTRIWINNTLGWSDWLPSGAWDSVNTYRTGILRHNHLTNDDSVYPYVSYTKEKYRDTLAAGVAYTIGEIGFRAGSTNRYDPHTGDLLARILGRTINTAISGEYDGELYLSSRVRRADGTATDTSTLALRRDLGAEFTHSGKKVQINAGNVTAENFYQNTPQDTAINALTRVDYVKGLLSGSLSSIIPLGSAVDLDTVKTAGFYSQPGNVNATAANHYPVQKAGNLVVTVSAGVIQKYWVYNSSEVWSRAQYSAGAWTTWERDYNTAFKPTAADVGTLTTAQINVGLDLKADSTFVNTELAKKFDKVGGTLTGSLIVANMKSAIKVDNQRSISFQDQSNVVFHTLSEGNTFKIKHGNNAENQLMTISSGGILETTGAVYSRTGLISQNAAGTIWLGMETPVSSSPYISVRSPGDSGSRQAITFNKGEVTVNNDTLASNNFRVAQDAGMKFSPNPTFAGVTWGMGMNPSTGWLGIHRYQDSVWQAVPMQITPANKVVFSGSVDIAGATTLGGYTTMVSAGNALLEFHTPGKTAAMIYKNEAGNLRFVTSNGSGGETFLRMQLDTGGNMSLAGAAWATSFNPGSDRRIKSNIVVLKNCLEKNAKIIPCSYNKIGLPEGKREVGVIAQDVIEVLPDAVSESPDGYYGVNYASVTALNTGAINELYKLVQELQEEIRVLKSK